MNTESVKEVVQTSDQWRRNLAAVLRPYGFWGLDPDRGGNSDVGNLCVLNLAWDDLAKTSNSSCAIFVDRSDSAALPGLAYRIESANGLSFSPGRRFFHRREAKFRSLSPSISFIGSGLTPILQTAEGRSTLAWWDYGGRRHLLCGIAIAEELVRYTHGNPERASYAGNRNLWGREHEQAAFLYEGHVLSGYELVPWADRLGFMLADLLARMSGLPLVCPLPNGAKGAVMLTGDDDQAWLEKYDEQLALLGDFPITYLMLPHTNHTRETIAKLPGNVEFGVHVDALDRPDAYAEICASQTENVRALLSPHTARTIRNHGHLNRDYWRHLPAWEAAGLNFDLNIRGLDGTCPTGSYLPFRVRRQDGTWSAHTSLFSTFSDSMLFLQKWSERKQVNVISGLADQIERSSPGVIVLNFHPQNVSSVRRVHASAVAIGRRHGWLAVGADSFYAWWERRDAVRLSVCDQRLYLDAPFPMEGLALRWPNSATTQLLEMWEGKSEVRRESGHSLA